MFIGEVNPVFERWAGPGPYGGGPIDVNDPAAAPLVDWYGKNLEKQEFMKFARPPQARVKYLEPPDSPDIDGVVTTKEVYDIQLFKPMEINFTLLYSDLEQIGRTLQKEDYAWYDLPDRSVVVGGYQPYQYANILTEYLNNL